MTTATAPLPKFTRGEALREDLPPFFDWGFGTELDFVLVKTREVEKPPKKKGDPPQMVTQWDVRVLSYKKPARMEARKDPKKDHPIPEYMVGQVVTLPNNTSVMNAIKDAEGKSGEGFWLSVGPEKSPIKKGPNQGTLAWQVKVGKLNLQ